MRLACLRTLVLFQTALARCAGLRVLRTFGQIAALRGYDRDRVVIRPACSALVTANTTERQVLVQKLPVMRYVRRASITALINEHIACRYRHALCDLFRQLGLSSVVRDFRSAKETGEAPIEVIAMTVALGADNGRACSSRVQNRGLRSDADALDAFPIK